MSIDFSQISHVRTILRYRHDFGVEDSYRKAVFESNLRFAEMMNKKGMNEIALYGS